MIISWYFQWLQSYRHSHADSNKPNASGCTCTLCVSRQVRVVIRVTDTHIIQIGGERQWLQSELQTQSVIQMATNQCLRLYMHTVCIKTGKGCNQSYRHTHHLDRWRETVVAIRVTDTVSHTDGNKPMPPVVHAHCVYQDR